MGKKTSTYARKRAMRQRVSDPPIHGLDLVTGRCQQYEVNTVFNPDAHLLPVRLALQSLMDRTVPADDVRTHDTIAYAIGEAEVRYLEIGGRDNNPAMPIIIKAGHALNRARERWKRLGVWGLDGPAIQELKDGIELYEQVLLVSTPQQMHDAAMKRWRWCQMQMSGELKKAA